MHDEATDRPDPQMSAIFARMTPRQRLAVAERLFVEARAMTIAAVRHQHPGWTKFEVQSEVFRRLHSDAG